MTFGIPKAKAFTGAGQHPMPNIVTPVVKSNDGFSDKYFKHYNTLIPTLKEEDVLDLEATLAGEIVFHNVQQATDEARKISSAFLNRMAEQQERGNPGGATLKKVLSRGASNAYLHPETGTSTPQFFRYREQEAGRFSKFDTSPKELERRDVIKSVISEILSGQFKDYADGNVWFIHDPKTSKLVLGKTMYKGKVIDPVKHPSNKGLKSNKKTVAGE